MKGGRTKFAILSLLRLGPLSGAEIKDYCQSRFGQFWSESYGQIYPALNLLCEQGLIRKLEDDEIGKSKKYEILDTGRTFLREWVETPSSDRLVRDELILKMFSASMVAPETLLSEIESALSKNAENMAKIEFGIATLREMNAAKSDAGYWALILRSGQLMASARQAWLEEVLAHVQARAKN
ncbi:MAG: PadR family transcriptional regulator [Hyphomonadaceae bacterium]|nr:PadR family transcriptional regulator [Hyphomonadaceae bacterium]